MSFNEGFNPAPHIMLKIPVGCMFDIPTCSGFVRGYRGEWILVGGLAPVEGMTGIPNSYKSTIAEYKQMRAMARMGPLSTFLDYDTESNKEEPRLRKIASSLREMFGVDPFNLPDDGSAPRFMVINKDGYPGEEFFTLLKANIAAKRKNPKKNLVRTPFFNRAMTAVWEILRPSAVTIDSFSGFETSNIIETQTEAELGSKDGLMIHQHQGLAKQRFLMEAPRLYAPSSTFLMMTAHMGKESAVQKGGGGKDVPVTKLSTLKNGDALKGVTGLFLSYTQNLWSTVNVKPSIADDGNGPYYPSDASDKLKYDTDLNEITLKNLRGKSGPSGLPVKIFVSQSEGVLDGLSEFDHIKNAGRFGLEGNNVHFQLVLAPDVTLTRPTVRTKIKESVRLQRAVNILSEFCQMQYIFDELLAKENLNCTPKELYDDIKALGYDWEVLLNTRGWWTLRESEHLFPPPLSILDILKMRKGEYHPFWLEADKKTVKPKWWEWEPEPIV